MFILTLLALFISILDIGSLALLLYIISFYTQGTASTMLTFLPKSLLNQDSVSLILVFFLFFVLKNFAAYLIFRAQYSFVYNVASRISQTNLLQFLEGGYSDYVEVDSSVQIRKIATQPIEFCHYVLAGIQQITSEAILISLAIVAILLFNASLFLLLLAILLPAVIVMSYLTRRKLRSVRANVKSRSEFALQYLQEALSGFIESNIYDKNAFFVERYSDHQKKLNHYLAELQITQGMPSRLIEIFAIFGLFILILVNKTTGNSQATGIITIGAFMAAAYKIIPGIVKILNISGQVRTYEYTITDLTGMGFAPMHNREYNKEKIESVSFENISFNYHNHTVLDGLDLNLRSGDFVGIAGYSGKGKTTVINLLLGFLNPDKGDILINGTPANSKARQSYWNSIAYVKQQPFLMRGTILHNITLGENHIDETRLQEAVEISGLKELTNQSSDGLQKLVTENGKNISGGQRQRIAIARAMYKSADLLILDEPFNELDEKSELYILNHLERLREKGKLIVLITHNQKSLGFCNKIVSLHEV